MLISGEELEKEDKEVLEGILAQVIEKYVKFKVYSSDETSQALKAFTEYLSKVYGLLLLTFKRGSLIIILGCPSLKSLELLWRDYQSGHLNEVAEGYLVTDGIKRKLNLKTIRLKTTIKEENYQNCREALMKLQSTSSGEYK